MQSTVISSVHDSLYTGQRYAGTRTVHYAINMHNPHSPFFLQRMKRKSSTKFRTWATGVVSRRHSLLRRVLPTSGREWTSVRGGSTFWRRNLHAERWRRTHFTRRNNMGHRRSHCDRIFCEQYTSKLKFKLQPQHDYQKCRETYICWQWNIHLPTVKHTSADSETQWRWQTNISGVTTEFWVLFK